jgi:hypothetical protein
MAGEKMFLLETQHWKNCRSKIGRKDGQKAYVYHNYCIAENAVSNRNIYFGKNKTRVVGRIFSVINETAFVTTVLRSRFGMYTDHTSPDRVFQSLSRH